MAGIASFEEVAVPEIQDTGPSVVAEQATVLPLTNTCLCCGQELPVRTGARGGPRLRYCPEGTGRFDRDDFSCKRHGAVVVAYRAATGAAPQPGGALATMGHQTATLQALLAPTATALDGVLTALGEQATLLEEADAKVTAAELAVQREQNLRAGAEQAREAAEADAVAARAATVRAETLADELRETTRRAISAEQAATKRAEEAASARRDAVQAVDDLRVGRAAEAARADRAEATAAELRAELAAARSDLETVRTTGAAERAAAQAQLDDLQRRLDEATRRVTEVSARLDAVTAERDRVGTDLAVQTARHRDAADAVERAERELSRVQAEHGAVDDRLRTARRAAAAVPDEVSDHPAVRLLLELLDVTADAAAVTLAPVDEVTAAEPAPATESAPPRRDLLPDLTGRLRSSATRGPGVDLGRLVEAALGCLREHEALPSGTPTDRTVRVIRAAIESELQGRAATRVDWDRCARNVHGRLALGERLRPGQEPTTHDPDTPAPEGTAVLQIHHGPLTEDAERHHLRVLRVEAARLAPGRVTAHTGAMTTEIRIGHPSATVISHLHELIAVVNHGWTAH